MCVGTWLLACMLLVVCVERERKRDQIKEKKDRMVYFVTALLEIPSVFEHILGETR